MKVFYFHGMHPRRRLVVEITRNYFKDYIEWTCSKKLQNSQIEERGKRGERKNTQSIEISSKNILWKKKIERIQACPITPQGNFYSILFLFSKKLRIKNWKILYFVSLLPLAHKKSTKIKKNFQLIFIAEVPIDTGILNPSSSLHQADIEVR